MLRTEVYCLIIYVSPNLGTNPERNLEHRTPDSRKKCPLFLILFCFIAFDEVERKPNFVA